MRDSSRSEERPVEEVEAQRLRKAKLERVSRYITKDKKAGAALTGAGVSVEQARRKTGIDILGDVAWGVHFCVFYQSKQDLIDILVPYFKAGLENNEFCMWITSEPLSAEDAEKSLSQAVTNLDDYIKKGQIEILDYSDWYTKSGSFEADSVLKGWVQKHDQAIRNGFDGLRLTGNTLWLEKKDWVKFNDYESVVNGVIGKYKMLAICTYSLDKCGASEILDVENNHQFSLIKWRGDWKILESSSKNQLEARLAEQTAITKALERSKKDWVKTFNAMSDWVALIDLKGRILRTNRAGENFTGKTLDEITGQSCCKLVHSTEEHLPDCPLTKMLRTGQQASAELQVPGTDRWLMVTVDPVTDREGNIVGAVHITRDISDRKKAEKAVRDSEERYKYLFEQSPLGIELATADGKVVRVNKTMEVITGYFEAELKKLNLVDLYENPEDRKKLLETIERYGCAVDFPTRLKRKDGTIYDALLNVSRVHLAGQDLFQTICVDITERRKAEVALRASEQRYRTLIESSHEVILCKDRDGHYHTLNLKAAIGLGGTCIEDIEGKTDYDLLPKEQADSLRKIDKEVMESGKDIEVEEVVRDAQGEYRTYLSHKWPIYDSQGRINGISCFAMDIMERKKVEEQIGKLAKFPAENPNPVLRISARGTVIYANAASLPLLKVWRCRVGRSVSGRWYEFVLDALSSGQSQQTEFQCGEQTFSIVFAPVMDANYVNVYGHDITERKRAETKLLDYQEQLKSLTSQLTLTEEQERRRIATDLHDNITQSLAMSKLKLDLVRDSKSSSSADFDEVLNETSKNIEQIMQGVRTLTFDLSSSILYELGFEAAVAEWLTERIEREHYIATEFEDDGQPKPLDDDTRTVLFRDVRELLTNVVKHAQAKKVKVSVRKVGSRIHVIVEDDGRGFDPKEAAATAAKAGEFGLFSIRERLKQLGGNIEIESAAGHGTRVTLAAPLKSKS